MAQYIYSKQAIKNRIARLGAIQSLYLFYANHDLTLDEAITNVIDIINSGIITGDKECNTPLLIELARSANANKVSLITNITPLLGSDWRFERLAQVVQFILLIATQELSSLNDKPKAIIINEYIEIARILNHGGEAYFINSVLDKFNSTDDLIF